MTNVGRLSRALKLHFVYEAVLMEEFLGNLAEEAG